MYVTFSNIVFMFVWVGMGQLWWMTSMTIGVWGILYCTILLVSMLLQLISTWWTLQFLGLLAMTKIWQFERVITLFQWQKASSYSTMYAFLFTLINKPTSQAMLCYKHSNDHMCGCIWHIFCFAVFNQYFNS